MKRKLKQVLALSGLESSVYQVLLFVHQLLLYRYIDKSLYGHLGTLFSLVYLAALHTNLGLDLSIAPLFTKYTRQHRGLAKQLFLHAGCNIGLAIFFCMLLLFWINSYNHSFIMLCGLAIAECTKKTCKTILGLLFFQKYIACIEILGLITYISIIWSCLLLAYEPSSGIIFGPLLIVSLLSITLYVYPLIQWYYSLIDTSNTMSYKRLIVLRIKNYCYQVSHSWYSPNFLIPMLALQYPMDMVGMLKMLSMGAYSINNMIQHTFGMGSSILFAYIKKQETIHKQRIIVTLQKYLWSIILVLLLCMALHYYATTCLYAVTTDQHLYVAYLFLLLISIEHAGIAHEYFYIVEERTRFLIILNSILSAPLLYMHYCTGFPALTLISILLCIRFIYTAIFYLYGWYHWKLQLKLPAKPLYLSVSVTCLLVYLFFVIS